MSISYLYMEKLKTSEDFNLIQDGKELYEKCDRIILKKEYYKTHEFRKNGVKCICLRMYTDKVDINHVQWQAANLKWAHTFFSASSEVIDNRFQQAHDSLVHLVYLIPFAPRGAVSCDWYCGGKIKMSSMQESYQAVMKKQFGLSRPSDMTLSRQSHIKLSGADNPFEDIRIPQRKDYPDESVYEKAISEYINKLRTKYELKIVSLEAQTSEKLSVANSFLTKENQKLNKMLKPFLDFLASYGGVEKAEQMIQTAQIFQYAIRGYQEEGDQASIQAAMRVLQDGRDYVQKHTV